MGEAELGFFVRETGTYVRRTFAGEHEIGSLTGNLSELEGKPAITLPLRFVDGTVFLGPLKLAVAPPLF